MSDISVAIHDLLEANMFLRLDLKKLGIIEKSVADIKMELQPLIKHQYEETHLVSSPHLLQFLSQAISDIGLHGRQVTSEHQFLRSLHFPVIEARQQKIPDAHKNTYDWIFPRSLTNKGRILPLFLTQPAHPNHQESSEDRYCRTLTSARFSEWLERHNGIFWVEGKAGSGKSTLMKFISGHKVTSDLLLSWSKSHLETIRGIDDQATALYADDAEIEMAYTEQDTESFQENLEHSRVAQQTKKRLAYESELLQKYLQKAPDELCSPAKLVVAKYFFWNPGSRLQKSQEGLLRSLLVDIIRQCPEMVNHIHSSSDERLMGIQQANWTLETLMLILEECVTVRISASFCFFVDGLDEFHEENRSTFRHLINTLNRIAAFPNVKICVSSRPWTIFLDAFQASPERTFRLEDLTRGDIRKYVTDNFKKHEQYERLSRFDAGYSRVIEEVSTRAQGVFLWVYLVVKDLLDGLTYNDSVQTMMQRLSQFPRGLEEFFQHIIDRVPDVYRNATSRTFSATLAANEPLLLMHHSFMDHIESDPNYCTRRPQLPLGHGEVAFLCQQMKRQIEGRTKGLLEIVSGTSTTIPYFSARVDFLHRTVKEFLEDSDRVQNMIISRDSGHANPSLMLCRGTVALLRYAPFQTASDGPGPPLGRRAGEVRWFHTLIRDFVVFAKKALEDPDSRNTVFTLFGVVVSACTALRESLKWSECDAALREAACREGALLLLKQCDLIQPDTTAVELKSRVQDCLRIALCPTGDDGQFFPDTIGYLLDLGAGVNKRWETEGETPFTYFVSRLNSGNLDPEDVGVLDTLKLLISYGGNLSVTIGDSATAEEIIRQHFTSDQVEWLLLRNPPGHKRGDQAIINTERRIPDNEDKQTRSKKQSHRRSRLFLHKLGKLLGYPSQKGDKEHSRKNAAVEDDPRPPT